MAYIPDVEDDMKPKDGQQFESLDATYKFYNDYSFKARFSVRKSKEMKRKGITFNEEHNHPPTTPSKVHLLRSQRTVSTANKNLIQDLRRVDIPIYQQFELFETQDGGHANVGCTERDLRNVVRDEREEVKGHDVDILYEHFKAEQEKDPAMPKSAPNVIITDQDQAMSKAIAHVLPNTIHRYCVWHILKKFPEKTNVAFMQDYYELFKTCIWDSECPEEFEKRWFEALEKSQQTNNEWLEKMYELRGRWIPAYVNKYFSAGMSSSQRVESAHAFFKRYCDKENSLMDFVTRFNRAAAHQRHEELVDDHKDLNETPNLKLGMPIEVQMSQLYTKKYFQYFQAQLHDSNGYIVNAVMEDNSHCVYNTERVFAQNLRMRTLVHYRYQT
ncbi:protein FAR1-RELATED SEQUENCE 5-like [Rosa chinensis]|uniref:protein FAR1-RELATED SEQUENCE 5-like n=1 Tax=Rosa chinensis TaxID=74649 RepID=UPI000D0970CB|nr:protein FAR1-RELATED SEQUENCE 5-like [Rosa chinensis]